MMAQKFVSDIALKYIKNKELKTAFSYKDVWNEEHAAAFTVAKAMQIDVLTDIKGAVEKALEDGWTFEHFKKELKPTLMQKGWWGRQEMDDPLTGKKVNAQLGSDRRLKTIYRTNLRSAYQKGQYERTMESDAHPYLMYCIGPSVKHRADHASWNGLILPKDDPWWDSHLPPNGWGCKCHTRAITEARKKRYEENGIPQPRNLDGSGGEPIKPKTQRPKTTYKTFVNERKGIVERIPNGITPGFNWNQGLVGREVPIFQECLRKARADIPNDADSVMETLMRSQVFAEKHRAFVDEAFKNHEKGISNKKKVEAVGFLDSKITKFLEQKGINIGERGVILLEHDLIIHPKYFDRHAKAGNAPQKSDWLRIIDYLLDASVYWDERHRGLVYLVKQTESEFLKIAVDLNPKNKFFNLPKVDTMFQLHIADEGEAGVEAYRQIMKMEKVK